MAMKKYCLDGEIAEFDFHDEEGFWSFCGPKSLKAFLATLANGEKAEIEINSPGGSVIAGVEMANAIKNSGAHLIAHVTGMAASMASVIACACDEIVLEEASILMIHDPWTECAGNADELRKNAAVLDQMKAMILGFYRGKFKKCSEAELSDLMAKTTYLTANECLEAGLEATVVQSDIRFAAKLTVRDLANAPESARAFFKTSEMPDSVKAAIEAAREAAAKTEDPAPAAAPSDEENHEAASEEPSVQASAPAAEDWEARYKGASKKINELQDKIVTLERQAETASASAADYAAAVAEVEAFKNEVDELKKQLEAKTAEFDTFKAESETAKKEFKDKLEKADKDLVDANAKISDLTGKLETSEKALADSRQQLDHFKSTRDLLTGGVLTPTDGENSYKAKMAKAKTPEEREKLRGLKKAGKIK